MKSKAVGSTSIPGLPAPRRGKVRDVYDLGDRLLLVATDRLSAYDHVLSPPIPDKGKILNQLTNFWFAELSDLAPNHLVSTRPEFGDPRLAGHRDLVAGRSVLARKANVVAFECVARGYLAGSAFQEYQKHGTACGIALPPGLVRASRLPEPIFTPATKAESGHDVNVTIEFLAHQVGEPLTHRLRDLTLALYVAAASRAESVGLLLADTKFEFGWIDGELVWIDEALTPDSSRYWEAARWRPGEEPVSFDKQFVRNWLDASGWDRESTPPTLPEEVVEGTRARYLEAFRRLTGRDPEL